MKRNTLPQRGRGLFGNSFTSLKVSKGVQRCCMLTMMLLTTVFSPGIASAIPVTAGCEPYWDIVGWSSVYEISSVYPKTEMVTDKVSGTIYMATVSGSDVIVKRMEPGGWDWEQVGETITIPEAGSILEVHIKAYGGHPYVVVAASSAGLCAWKYNGEVWTSIGGSGFNLPSNPVNTEYTLGGSVMSMEIDEYTEGGRLLVAFATGGNYFQLWGINISYDEAWSQIGSTKNAGYYYPSPVVRAYFGVPYVAYTDEWSTASVVKPAGDEWSYVGSPHITAGTGSDGGMTSLNFKIGNDGSPYIAFSDMYAGGAYVFKGTNLLADEMGWFNINSDPYSIYGAPATQIALGVGDDGTAYIMTNDYDGNRCRVRKYSYDYWWGDTWQQVGEGGGFVNSDHYSQGLCLDLMPDNLLVVSSVSDTYWPRISVSKMVPVATHTITTNSWGEGGVYNTDPYWPYWDHYEVCEGNSASYSIEPYPGWRIDRIWVNGMSWSIDDPHYSYLELYGIWSDQYIEVQFVPDCTPPTIVHISANDPTCGMLYDGSAVVEATGTGPLYYYWSTGYSSESPYIYGLPGNTYFVSAINECGSDSREVTLNTPVSYTLNGYYDDHGTISPSSYEGVCDGESRTFTITPHEGYIISSVTVDDEVVGAMSLYTFPYVTGNHVIRAYYEHACTPPELGVSSSSNPTCGVFNNGTINTSAFGTEPLSWLWSNGATTDDISGLTGGTYYYSVTNGCGSVVSSVTLTDPTTYTITGSADEHGSISPASFEGICENDARTFTFTPNEGYAISAVYVNGVNIGTPTSYSFGHINASHTISVEFAATCTAPVLGVASSSAPSCFGYSNGTINTSATGTAPLTWSWSNGATTSNISGLTAGVYTYTVSNGCGTVSATVTIGQPAALTASNMVTNVNCFGQSTGSVSVSAIGGTMPYMGTGLMTGKAAGVHNFTVTDANGCTASTSATVAQPASALNAAKSVTDVLCKGGNTGSVTVTAMGGTAPYGGTGTFSGLTAGPYTYTVTDANGCTSSVYPTVGQPELALAAIKEVTSVLCYGGNTGSVTITAAGGTMPYSGTGTFSGLTAGNYSYTVTDAHGCTANSYPTVGQPATALAAMKSVSNVLCYGGNTGSVTMTASGGTAPYGGTGTFGGLTAGPYTFTVTDANGCTASSYPTVGQPAAPLASMKTVSDVRCFGGNTGSVTMTASGGTTPYSGTGTFSGLTAGSYVYTVTDANGCTASSYPTVGQPAAPLTSMKSVSDVLCYGGNTGSVTMTASGGTAPYSGIGTFSGLTAGPYTYTVTDANGCTASSYPTVGQPSAPLSASNMVTNVFCYGASTGRVNVSATGGTAPYTGTGIFSGLAAGTYSFAVTDAHGCSTITWATVTQPEGGLVASKSVTNVDCFGNNTGSVLVSATGGTMPYIGTGNMTGLTAGTYTFTVTDGQGCPSTVIATVTEPSQLVASQAVTNVSCYGMNNGQVIVGATGGTSPYVGTGTNTSLSPEPYSYTVTDAHGCTSTVSGAITQPTLLVASNTPVISASGFNLLCNKGNTGIVNVSATGGTAPYYNTGAHGGLTATDFEFYVTDSHGCIDSTSGTLDQPDPFYVSASTSDDTICNGESVTLSATGGAGSFLWAVNNGLPITYSSAPVTATPSTGTPTVTVGYTVVGFNTFGCSSEPDTVDVTVLPIGYFTGSSAVCTDYSVDLDNGTPGGVWYTPDTAYFSVDQDGIVGGQHYMIGGTYPTSGTISYTMPNGCYRTRTMTVNRTPDPIVGIATVCPNSGLSLPAGIPSGGTWSSSNSNMTITMSTNGIATVNGGSTLGTATISYIMPAGCYVTKQFTIAPMAPITGPTTVCTGNTIQLVHPLPGAQWSSSNTSMATVNISTGVVTGISASSVIVTYKVNPTCYKTYTVNVNTTPAAVTGPVSVCKAANITIADATAGGTWVSDNTSAATVGSTTGIVNGADVGVANISYVMPTGCYKKTTVTVNDNPASITGSTNVCVSRTATYTTTSTGGTWSSSSSVLTIGGGSGVANGVAAGTANVSYTFSTGCFSVKPVNVSAQPAAITGTFTACQGSTTTVNCTTPSLTWSSSDEDVATVGSTSTTSATVSGLLPGTTTISYTSAAGCTQSMNVTVYATPTTIGGTTNVCVGATATYTNSVTGGTWSSSATGVATVGSLTGIVTGIGAGTCNLIYTAPGGCKTTKMLTLDAQPTTFTGTLSTCVVGNTLLASTPTGGTWSTTSPNASVNASTGLVTGVAMGSAIISYTNTAGCSRAGTVTIAAGLPAIVGPSFICVGGSTTLTNTTGGGTWVSSTTAAGTIAAGTGLIGGVATGNTTITYRTNATCHTTKDIAVVSAPAPISAPSSSVCIGTPLQLTHAITTGTWSSSTPANATVGSATGMVTGLAAGTTTISYTTTPGCLVTQLMSVNAQPAVLTGTLNVCQGNTTTVNCMTASGTWTSSNPDIAAVVTNTTTSGIITGGTIAGTVVISYTNALGCSRTAVATVNAAVPAITGYDVVCVGNATPLSIAATGGTWSSSLPAKGSISTVGVVAGVATGSTTITYKTSSTCFTTKTMSVNGAVAGITGATSVCKDNSASLVCTTPGGVWATSSANASVIDTNGLVTGLATGSAVISYQLTGMGCYKTYTVNVLASPAPITGTMTIAIGTTTTLNNTVTGGTWSSSASTVASIGSTTGAMIGVTAGSATITYKLTSNGCYKTALATVVTSMARPVKGTEMQDAAVTTVRIFPNPSLGNITVEAPANGTFAVFSMDGKQVARFDVTAPSSSVSLPYDLAAGMYMCHFEGVDGSSAIVRLVYKP